MSLKSKREARRRRMRLNSIVPNMAFGLPGTCLKAVLQNRYNIPPCSACHQLAAEMDKMGPAQCRDEVDDLAPRLKENAENMMGNSEAWLGFLKAAAAHPLQAIKAATGDLDLYKDLILEACTISEAEKFLVT